MARRVLAPFSLVALSITLSLVAGHHAFAAGDCSKLPTVLGTDIPSVFPLNPRALQDNPTGFGDATPPSAEDSEGNELNRLFIANDSSKLYIGITGNTERSDSFENTVLVFIDTGDNGGTEILNTSGFTGGSNALLNLDVDDMTDGVRLDFAPEWCLAVWNVGGTQFGYLHDLTNPTDAGSVLVEGVDFAVDNSNLAGVNDVPSSDPLFQQQNAATATTGFEFAVDLASLGLTSSSTIRVQALLASGSGFISNQSLPPLRATVGSSGGGVACVGIHDPDGDPPNIVDFNDNARFPGSQNVFHGLNSGGMAPSGMFDGTNIPDRYTAVGQLLATQNNYTCFGNAQPFSPIPTGGAELNQIFAKVDFSKLYIGVTGNIPFFGGNNDTLMIFIDSGSGDGSETLFTANFTGGSGALQGMSQGAAGGFTFDNGFAPDHCIMYWRAGAQHNARIMSTVFDDHIDGLEFSPAGDRHTNIAVNAFSADLGNILGVNDIPGDDPIRQEDFAQTATSGIQFSLRLADLGIDATGGTANFKMAACVVSGSGFVSNQFLPPLNPTDPTPLMDSAAFSDSPLPLAIPDDEETPATDTRAVSMPSIGRVTDVNVSVGITHPDVSQLEVSLLHNDSGREVVLVAPGDRTGANLNITFDSEGAAAVQPSESLLTFNGVDPNGNWTLTVLDTVSGDSGTLDSWGLDVTEFIGGNVPCLGQFDAVDNPINLATDPRTPGDQFFTLSLGVGSAPNSFTGLGIPAAFLNTPLAGGTQNNYTCFGNAVEAPSVNLPGSELNQLRIRNTSTRLRVGLTGNLEDNGNAVVLLLDTNSATGAQTLPVLSSPPDAASGLDGLTLDAGFKPDYAVVVQRDPTAGVPVDDYNVFLKNINTNVTRSIGRLTRNAPTGELAESIPNQNGSELNQLFVQNDAARLYIGATGNLEANGNTFIFFLQTTANGSGTNILDTDHVGFPAALRAISSDRMDVGFHPDYAIVLHRSGGFYNAQLVDLLDLPPGVTVTELTFSTTIDDNVFIGDNTNASGVNSNPADDDDMGSPPSQQIQNAQTATRGVQFAIARSSLERSGGPTLDDGAPIKINAILVSGNGFWSNQTLPGLGGESPNLGAPPPPGRPTNFIDLSAEVIAPGDQFTSFNLATSGSYASPSTFNGANIPTAMGTAIATQDNYTGFGNATLVNPGNPNCTQVAFNNENILGVTATSATPAQAESATSGFHFDLDFADLGLTPVDPVTGPFVEVRVMAVITGRFGFFSNQFLPPLMRDPPAGNLGDIPGGWSGDLSDNDIAPGDQFLAYALVPFCGDDAADINGDEVVDENDIDAFVGVLLGTNNNPCDVQKSDFNGDGFRNALDIQKFVQEFLSP